MLTASATLRPCPPAPLQSAGALAHLLLLTAGVVTLLVAAGVLVLGDLTRTLGDLPTALRGARCAGLHLLCCAQRGMRHTHRQILLMLSALHKQRAPLCNPSYCSRV